MKGKFYLPVVVCAMLLSCNGVNKAAVDESESEAAGTTTTGVELDGVWQLVSYVYDGEMVRVNGDDEYCLHFFVNENAFGMNTDCNSLGGEFVSAGDSIRFENILSTMMACPDEKIEMSMKTILPEIKTYDVADDSILSLKSGENVMAVFMKVKDADLVE